MNRFYLSFVLLPFLLVACDEISVDHLVQQRDLFALSRNTGVSRTSEEITPDDALMIASIF